ncbi:hypothetical protein [Actibacterium sp. D379-3]
MKVVKLLAFLVAGSVVAACDRTATDKTVDTYIGGRRDLSQLRAGIWVDPTGCDQWIIDDGAEGYLSARLDKYGKPVCSGVAPPTTAIGPYKTSGVISDPI